MCIDKFHGTLVFGYRDLRSGKFKPKANFSFTVVGHCHGKRFTYPSWQLEVHDREYRSMVLMPEGVDRLKTILTTLSEVLKRGFYSSIPDKKFIDYYQLQIIEHLTTKDINRVIVSYTGVLTLI